jgi:hypothetical protein
MAEEQPAEPIAAPPGSGQGPAVQSSRLLTQCRPAGEMIRRTHTLPGGIWVQGRRLRAPEFLGAMATILQQLRYFGVMPDLIAIHPYQAPPQWAEATALAAAPTTAAPGAAAQPIPAAPAPPIEAPSLRLMPAAGQIVKGEAPLTVIYHGPAAFLRIAIDGKVAAVSNVSPFTVVWDTRLDTDGTHTVAAEAVAGGRVVAQARIALTVKNGGPSL